MVHRPGYLNSLAGLISTLLNIYNASSGGEWTTQAKVTVCIIGGCAAVNGGLFFLYEYFVISAVKKEHSRQMGRDTTAAGKKPRGFCGRMFKSLLDSAMDVDSISS